MGTRIPKWEDTKPLEEKEVPKWEDTNPVEEVPLVEKPRDINQLTSKEKSLIQQAAKTKGDLSPEQLEALKVAFKPQMKDPSFLNSLWSGIGKGVSWGFNDEILATAIATYAKGIAGVDKPFSELYKDSRNQIRQKQQEKAKQHPTADIAGDIIGSIISVAPAGAIAGIPAKITKKSTKIVPLMLKTAQTTGLAGVIEGIGRSEADLIDDQEWGKLAVDTALFAIPSALGGAAISGAAKKLMKNPIAKKTLDESKINITDKVIKRLEKSTSIEPVSSIMDNKELKKLALSMTSDTPQNLDSFKKIATTEDVNRILTLLPEMSEKSPTIAKLAEQNLSKEELAFNLWQREMRQFGSFIAAPKQKMPRNILDSVSIKRAQKIDKIVSKEIKQGNLNSNTYKLYRSTKFAIEEINNSNELQLKKKFKGFVDPNSNFLWRTFGDLRYVAASVDNKVGTEMGILVDDMVKATYSHASFCNKYFNNADNLISNRKKAMLDSTELYNLLTDRNYLTKQWKNLNKQQREVITNYKDIFNSIRKDLNNKGAYISKLENYAPLKAKEVIEYGQELKKWAKELDIENSNVMPTDKAFTRSLEDLYGESINSVKDLKYAIKNIDKIVRLKTSSAVELSAAFKRKGDIHPRLKETDIDKLLIGYINNSSKGAFLAQPIKAIESQSTVLKELGLDKSARYFANYAKDMAGIPRGLNKASKEAETAYYNTVAKMFENKEGIFANITKESLEMAPQIIKRITHSIYPNALGLNPRAVLRNYTQPFAMTGTELGTVSLKYGESLALKSTLKVAAMQAKAGKNYLNVAQKFLTKRNLAPDRQVFEGIEELRSGFTSGIPKYLHKVLQKQEDFVMSLYTHSDYQNRLVTYFMAKDLSKDIFKAVKSSQKIGTSNLKGNQKIAMAFIDNMEPAYKNKLNRLIQSRDLSELDIRNLMSTYLINKTQFVYGKAGLNEFGRYMGPLFSMFTKWPSSIGSDVISKVQQNGFKGAYQAGKKYLAPLIALNVAKSMTHWEETPRGKELLTSQGFTYYSPILSVKDVEGLIIPPVIETGIQALEEVGSAATSPEKIDAKRIQRKIQRAAQTYIPGAVWYNTYKRVNPLIYNKEK